MKLGENVVTIRCANANDVDQLVELEKDVWGNEGADYKKISSRVKIFPEGNLIVLYKNKIIGYTCFEYVDDMREESNFTWNDVTDNGTIKKTHNPEGEFIYGVNLSVHRSMRGFNLGSYIMSFAIIKMIKANKKGAFIGARMPGYREYKKNHNIKASDYIKLKREDGHLHDKQLRMYSREGLLPLRALPNYFPDEESLNFGVLIFRKNIFYNWPFRNLIGGIVDIILKYTLRRSIEKRILDKEKNKK